MGNNTLEDSRDNGIEVSLSNETVTRRVGRDVGIARSEQSEATHICEHILSDVYNDVMMLVLPNATETTEAVIHAAYIAKGNQEVHHFFLCIFVFCMAGKHNLVNF